MFHILVYFVDNSLRGLVTLYFVACKPHLVKVSFCLMQHLLWGFFESNKKSKTSQSISMGGNTSHPFKYKQSYKVAIL